MTFAKFTKCLIGFVLLLFALCGFAGEPTLQSVQTFSAPEKIKKVIFLYEEKNFDFKETRYGAVSGANQSRPRTASAGAAMPQALIARAVPLRRLTELGLGTSRAQQGRHA